MVCRCCSCLGCSTFIRGWDIKNRLNVRMIVLLCMYLVEICAIRVICGGWMVQNGWCECEDGCLRTARQMLVNLLCGFCSTRSISFYPNCGDGTCIPGMQHCVAKPTKTKNPPNRRHCCESNLKKNALPHSFFFFFFVFPATTRNGFPLLVRAVCQVRHRR